MGTVESVWSVLLVTVLVVLVIVTSSRRTKRTPTSKTNHHSVPSSGGVADAPMRGAQMRRSATAREPRASKPSWMTDDAWAERLTRYRGQGRSDAEIADMGRHLERRGPPRKRPREELITRSLEIGTVTRAVYVPKEDEERYLVRDSDGSLGLRLVDAGDRLVIWSPVDGGGLLNPKGPGIRHVGLYGSYARGSDYYPSAYKAADLRKGSWIDLVREPANPHDSHATAMCRPGSRVAFGYVQRGRAPAVARRIDAGEDMAGVTLWGPGPRRADDTTYVLIGARSDLEAMLAQ